MYINCKQNEQEGLKFCALIDYLNLDPNIDKQCVSGHSVMSVERYL